MASATYSGDVATANGNKALAVINDVTAPGPTAKTWLLPKKAYANTGHTLAYKPMVGGKPANMA